jgi:hypothetical protein
LAEGKIWRVAGAVPLPEKIASQGWSLIPEKVSDPVPLFVILTLAGARLDVPTLAVRLKHAGLTDKMGVATGGALVSPDPYTDVKAPAE